MWGKLSTEQVGHDSLRTLAFLKDELYSIKNVKSVIRVVMLGNELKWSGDGEWLVDREWTRGMGPVRGYFSDQKMSE